MLPVGLAFCLDGWLVDPRGGWGPVGGGRPAEEPFRVGLVGGVENLLAGVDGLVGSAVVEVVRVQVANT